MCIRSLELDHSFLYMRVKEFDTVEMLYAVQNRNLSKGHLQTTLFQNDSHACSDIARSGDDQLFTIEIALPSYRFTSTKACRTYISKFRISSRIIML